MKEVMELMSKSMCHNWFYLSFLTSLKLCCSTALMWSAPKHVHHRAPAFKSRESLKLMRASARFVCVS